jgi:elongation factor G
MAFKMAGILAFHAAAEKAQPVILEPIMEVDVFTPDDFVGDVIGDLNQRRGQILGMEPAGRNQRVRALVPQSELYKYSTTLRSLSQGRATHTRTFHSYQEVPRTRCPSWWRPRRRSARSWRRRGSSGEVRRPRVRKRVLSAEC